MKKFFSLLLIFLLISCSVFSLQKDIEKTKMSITFGSVFENEELTLSINDSTYFTNKTINTNSLGIDPKSNLQIETDKIHLKGFFFAKIDPDFDENYTRKLKIDTILYKNNGHRIRIGANLEKYYISQQNKKFEVE